MFDPKKEVPSLELCKKLKELGYPQEGGGWYWMKYQGDYFLGLRLDDSDLTDYKFFDFDCEDIIYYPKETTEIIKAPTCRELAEWIKDFVWQVSEDGVHRIGNVNLEGEPWFEDITEPNARVKMLIWLIENNYISFKQEETNDMVSHKT